MTDVVRAADPATGADGALPAGPGGDHLSLVEARQPVPGTLPEDEVTEAATLAATP